MAPHIIGLMSDELIKAAYDPKWRSVLTPAKDGSLLQIDHPEHGTLSFVFPPHEAEKLGAFLLKQAGVAIDRKEAQRAHRA